MEEQNDILESFPVEMSETESLNDECFEQEPEEKKKEPIPEDLVNPISPVEEKKIIPPGETEVIEPEKEKAELQLLEERQMQNILEAEKMREAELESLLAQYDLTTIKTEDYKYIGYIKKDGSQHREYFGICYYTNGDVYVGQWHNDQKHGLGKFTFKNGSIFSGEFKDDIQDGYVEQLRTDKTWKGFMKDFKPCDDIVILQKDNEILFEGIIKTKNKKSIGIGKYYEKDSFYYGETADNFYKQGLCFRHKKNKFIYKGYLEKNQRHGYGEQYFSDGSKFFGFFKNNLKNGFGIEIFNDGRATLAKYEDDLKNGYVIVIHKGTIKIEIWHLGFKTKTVEKIDNPLTKQFLKFSYPEYRWALQINYKKLFDIFLNIPDEDAFIKPPEDKEKDKEKEKEKEKEKDKEKEFVKSLKKVKK